MHKLEAVTILEDLLKSELATRRASQGGLKPEEKKALKVAIKALKESQEPNLTVGWR